MHWTRSPFGPPNFGRFKPGLNHAVLGMISIVNGRLFRKLAAVILCLFVSLLDG